MSRWDPLPPSRSDRSFDRNLRRVQLGFVLAGLVALVVSVVLDTWVFAPVVALCWVQVPVLEMSARRQRRTWRQQGVDLDDAAQEAARIQP